MMNDGLTAFTIQTANWRKGAEWNDAQCLPCPVCGMRYGHVRHVATEIDPGGDENGEDPYSGTSETIEHKTGYRRPAVRINIEGECGHNWTLLIQQHKGSLVLHARWPSLDHRAGIAPAKSDLLYEVAEALADQELKSAKEKD
jgi:hypothetical protein